MLLSNIYIGFLLYCTSHSHYFFACFLCHVHFSLTPVSWHFLFASSAQTKARCMRGAGASTARPVSAIAPTAASQSRSSAMCGPARTRSSHRCRPILSSLHLIYPFHTCMSQCVLYFFLQYFFFWNSLQQHILVSSHFTLYFLDLCAYFHCDIFSFLPANIFLSSSLHTRTHRWRAATATRSHSRARVSSTRLAAASTVSSATAIRTISRARQWSRSS